MTTEAIRQAHLAHQARSLAVQANATAPDSPERRQIFAQLSAALDAVQDAMQDAGPDHQALDLDDLDALQGDDQ